MQFDWPICRRLGVRLSRFYAGKYEAVRKHVHNTTHLLFLLDGSMSEGVGGREVLLTMGEARLSGAHTEHNIDFGPDGAECLVIHVPGGLEPFGSQFLSAAEVSSHLATLTHHIQHPGTAPLAALEARRILHQLVARRPVPEWLHEAHSYLTSEQTPSVSAASRFVGVSREHLSRAFTLAFGVNPQVTRCCARLARTASSLLSGDAPAAHLAADLGYVDQSHMIREFRAAFGMTPSEFVRTKISQLSNSTVGAAG